MAERKRELTIDDLPEHVVQEHANKWYELGKVSVLEDLPKRFRKEAGEAFARGRDDDAHRLRSLADTFQKEATAAREAYWTKHPEDRV